MSVAGAGSGGIASTAKSPMELWGVTEILCGVVVNALSKILKLG